jgi:hypothetical protein
MDFPPGAEQTSSTVLALNSSFNIPSGLSIKIDERSRVYSGSSGMLKLKYCFKFSGIQFGKGRELELEEFLIDKDTGILLSPFNSADRSF